MKRVIVITETQKKMLKESETNAFEFLDSDNDVPSNVGNSQIGVSGKTDDKEYGKPATGDKISNSLTVQGWNRFNRGYGRYVTPTNIHENDDNYDGVDDFYNHDEMDVLSDGDDNNNLINVPQTVEQRLENLMKVINNMSPKQQAMVVNKIIENIKIDKIPYSWAKELMLKINTRKNVSQ